MSTHNLQFIAQARTLGAAAAFILCTCLPATAQTHVYNLSGSYADTNGGPSLTPNGGTLNTSGGYTFGRNQGFSLNNAISGADYTIDMTFSLTDLSSGARWRKLLDFNGLANDAGLYIHNRLLEANFAGDHIGIFTFTANQSATVELTRNNATKVVTGSANGVQQFSFIDSNNVAVFNTLGGAIHFFEDDRATSGSESSGGIVTNIKVTNSSSPVPEASITVSLGLLLALGLGGFTLAARKKKKA